MESETNQGARKSRSSSLRVASALLAIAALGAYSALFYLRRSHNQSAAQVQKEVSVLHLESFVVNLADSDQRTYLRVGIDLGISANSQAAKSAVASTALIRDTLLEILMSARSDELTTAEGKRKLKEQMLRTLNMRAPDLNAREIYFTEFLIQK